MLTNVKAPYHAYMGHLEGWYRVETEPEMAPWLTKIQMTWFCFINNLTLFWGFLLKFGLFQQHFNQPPQHTDYNHNRNHHTHNQMR